MEGTNAKTLEDVYTHNIYKRIKSRNNQKIEKIGFINCTIKLYIKYKELKIRLTNGIRKSDVRHQTSDIRHLTYPLVT